MAEASERIPTTHVGSLPRPQAVADLLFAEDRDEPIDRERYEAVMAEAVADVVRRQAAAGIDWVSDGEMSKISYATYIRHRLTGFEPRPNVPRATPRDLDEFPEYRDRLAAAGGTPQYRRPVCVGPIDVKDLTPLHRDLARLRAALGQVDVAGAFVTPALIGLVVFALGPFLFTIWVSLHRWNMLTPVTTMPYRGFANYRYLLNEDPLFRQTFGNTVSYAVGNVALSVVLALGVALLLNGPVKLRAFWRAAFFVPYVTAPVAIAIVWRNMYDPNYGMINGLLDLVGLPAQPFLSSIGQAMPSLIAVAVWHDVGYYMIIFLAGLQAIPYDLYEAAKLDGAGVWRLFWSITLPLLRPTLLFVVVVNTLGSLQVFDLPFILTQGGPVNATNTLVMYMYDTAFKFLRMERATAMAVMLFLVIFVMTLIQLRLLREKE